MKILLCGGSACGKSTYAEKLALSLDVDFRYYIATMRPYDDECLKKIERHKKQRESGSFTTIEKDCNISEISLKENSCALLECVCNLCANEMFDEFGNMKDITDKIVSDVLTLSKKCRHLIVVTNTVGSDIPLSYSSSTLEYIHTLETINLNLANKFDKVYELVCGIALPLKGELIL